MLYKSCMTIRYKFPSFALICVCQLIISPIFFYQASSHSHVFLFVACSIFFLFLLLTVSLFCRLFIIMNSLIYLLSYKITLYWILDLVIWFLLLLFFLLALFVKTFCHQIQIHIFPLSNFPSLTHMFFVLPSLCSALQYNILSHHSQKKHPLDGFIIPLRGCFLTV